MITRRAAAVALAASVLFGASACTSAEPDPTRTPPFASEAEAFAAAEDTYRAYVDALNGVDLSDPETFEPVFALTTGELNASDRQGLSSYHAEGVTVSGASDVLLAEVLPGSTMDDVHLTVCLDVAQVEVEAQDGASLVSPDRVDVQSLRVVLVRNELAPTRYLINEIAGREGPPECDG